MPIPENYTQVSYVSKDNNYLSNEMYSQLPKQNGVLPESGQLNPPTVYNYLPNGLPPTHDQYIKGPIFTPISVEYNPCPSSSMNNNLINNQSQYIATSESVNTFDPLLAHAQIDNSPHSNVEYNYIMPNTNEINFMNTRATNYPLTPTINPNNNNQLSHNEILSNFDYNSNASYHNAPHSNTNTHSYPINSAQNSGVVNNHPQFYSKSNEIVNANIANSLQNLSLQTNNQTLTYSYNKNVHATSNIAYNNSSLERNHLTSPNLVSQQTNYNYNRPVNLFQLSQIFPFEPEKPVTPSIPENLEPFNCPTEFVRSSLTTLPQTPTLLDKVRLPLGIILHPFNDKQEIPLVTDQVMSRCKSCRTYINPFITLLDMRRWKCNICYRTNELPEEYYYDANTKAYIQPYQRLELQNSAVEFIASSDYMIRPPQPTVYFFVLEVTTYAISTNYLEVFSEILSTLLDELPGDSRTMVGFLTFDQNLHFYRFREDSLEPEILVCPDTEEPFVPCDGNLLVNLKDFKKAISHFVTNILPNLWDNSRETRNALGPALKVAQKLMSPYGGRLTIMLTTLPSVGCGALPNREDPNLRADQGVSIGLKPQNDFYKKLALDFTNDQVSADFFFLPCAYVDIATLSTLSKFSGGNLYHFPSYHSENNPLQAERFEQSLKRYLTRDLGFEAVLRVRSSKGLNPKGFYGNFFLRSSNLLCLPTVKPDSSYTVHYEIEDDLIDSSIACVQSAILYTTSQGERRIRVLTLALPISNNFDDIINGADQEVVTSLIAVMAADRCLTTNLHQAREAMITAVQDYLNSFNKHAYISINYNNLLSPHSCCLIPIFVHSLLKHIAFRVGVSTKLDDRAFSLYSMQGKPVESLILEIFPHLYSINYLSSDEIRESGNDNSKYCSYIPIQELSAKALDPRSSYLLDVGEAYIIYVAKLTPPSVIEDIFGTSDFSKIVEEEVELNTSSKISGFLDCLQNEKPYFVPFLIVKEDGANRNLFRSYMIQDKSESSMSYHEFLLYLVKEIIS